MTRQKSGKEAEANNYLHYRVNDQSSGILAMKKQLTENRRFGRKKELRIIFVALDMCNDLTMSSRMGIVAVAVSAINGISNFKNFNLLVLKFSRKTDSRLINSKGNVVRQSTFRFSS